MTRIQIRRDTAADWTAANPILAEGELGFEADTDQFKIGDGSTPWVSLAYQGASASVAAETARAESAEALLAPKASPTFTGNPVAPTQSPLTNSTRLATTAYTDQAVAVEVARATGVEVTKAPTGFVARVDVAPYNAAGDGIIFQDGAIQSGASTFTSSTITSGVATALNAAATGGNPKTLYCEFAGASSSIGTVGTGLSTGSPITAITLTSALGSNLAAQDIVVSSGAHAQCFTCTGASSGATSLPVVSETPTFAFPSGAAIKTLGAGFVATVSSATTGSATLSANASSTIQNAAGVFGTDDTAAIQAAIDAVGTAGGGTVLYDAKNYVVASAARTDRDGNAILALPRFSSTLGAVGTQTQFGTTIRFLGATGQTRICAAYVGASYSSSYGIPSTIGGPTQEGMVTAGLTGTIFPIAAEFEIDGITVLQPENPTLSGVDLGRYQNMHWHRTSHVRTYSTLAFSVLTSATQHVFGSVPSNPQAVALRTPLGLNANRLIIEHGAHFMGHYAAVITFENLDIMAIYAYRCTLVLGWDSSVDGSTFHGQTTVYHMSISACKYHIGGWSPSSGVVSLPAGTQVYLRAFAWTDEDDFFQWGPTAFAMDANNAIVGKLDWEYQTALGYTASPSQITAGNRLDTRPIDPSIPPAGYDDVVLADSPVAYYPLNEHSGTTAQDASGGTAGTYTGTPILGLSGPMGTDGSVNLKSASSQYVLGTTLGTLGANIGSSTVEFWLKTTTTNQEAALGTQKASTGTAFFIKLNQDNTGAHNAGYTDIALGDQSGTFRNAHFTTNIYDGNWHHVVILPSVTATPTAYVDGQPVNVTLQSSPPTLGTLGNFGNPMGIGVVNNTGSFGFLYYMDGRLAKVAFYGSQLSAARVSARWSAAIKR